MKGAKLVAALDSVDWKKNIAAFTSAPDALERMESASMKLAIWSKQLEGSEVGNPALCFVREMQAAGHMVVALTALSLYKAAAASLRSMLETALYYTYFRNHPAELATLVRDVKYFVSKSDIVEYHRLHTNGFIKVQRELDLIGRLDIWYSEVSAIVHGQIPGKWLDQKSFSDIKHSAALQTVVIDTFCAGVEVVHNLFLCTIADELWDSFSSTGRRQLLFGLDGKIKTALGLDSA